MKAELVLSQEMSVDLKKIQKKGAQCESCVLVFLGGGGKMRTAARDRVSQIGLRNFSKEVVGNENVPDFGEGGIHAIKRLSYKRFSASHKELMSPWRVKCFSRYEEIQGLRL